MRRVSERGAKAIRFTSKRGNDLDPGVIRLPASLHPTTTPVPVLTSAAPPPQPSEPAPMFVGTALQPAEPPSPWSALRGVVSDCLFGFSPSCLQRKLLVFVNRLSRMERVK